MLSQALKDEKCWKQGTVQTTSFHSLYFKYSTKTVLPRCIHMVTLRLLVALMKVFLNYQEIGRYSFQMSGHSHKSFVNPFLS